VKVSNDKFKLVGDSAKPWYCWDGFDRDWSEPKQENFG
jgi:hypothetical protein